MSVTKDLEARLNAESISAMLEQAGGDLARHEALDFSGFDFEAIRKALAGAKAGRYLPGPRGGIPRLPDPSPSGEIVFELGSATIAIPAAYAPYVRYVHEMFGTPTGEDEMEIGRALKYFHTLRQWVGALPGTLREQTAEFLQHAPRAHEQMRERMDSYREILEADPNLEVVAHVPYMFAYLCNLVVDPEVPADVKVDIAMGIVYFASPVDILPEAFIDHPIAFADDACVALWVLKALEGSIATRDAIEGNWPGEAPLPAHTSVWERPLRELLGEDLVDAVNLYFAMKRGRRILRPVRP